jgi:hypothetical protein
VQGREHKPYDWEGADDLGLDLPLPQQWHRPIDTIERAFWRGVLVGGLVEAFFVLVCVLIIWLVRF